jgi:hypothetical protein
MLLPSAHPNVREPIDDGPVRPVDDLSAVNAGGGR